jgi:hypothetical protein
MVYRNREPLLMNYFKTPSNKYLAFIPRSGSTSFARAIINQFYPELLPRLEKKHPNKTDPKPQFICPSSSFPDGDTYALIRDPVERFRSGFSRANFGRTVDEVIEDLFRGECIMNVHIEPQSDRIKYQNDIKCFKFPEGINALSEALGMTPPEQENESEDGEKPNLTQKQIDNLRKYYFKDVELYENASVEYTPTTAEPTTAEPTNINDEVDMPRLFKGK